MFGRYTDAFKSNEQLEAWNNAVSQYEAKDFLKSFTWLLAYLRDPKEDNVRWVEKDGSVEFTISQGSQFVRGKATSDGIVAQAQLARINQQSVSVMRRLLELNFSLDYCRYGISEEEIIALRFDADAINSHPNRLYYALRELALNSDKQDDFLSDNFSALSIVNNQNTKPLPKEFIEAKYDFLVSQIQSTLAAVNLLDQEKEAGAISWLLMSLLYKIDYLTSPHGSSWITILKIQQIYYNPGKPLNERNALIKTEFENLISQPKENITGDFYDIINTFAVTKISNPDDVKNNILESIKSYPHWNNEKNMYIAIAVLEHGLGNSLFNFSIPKIVRDFIKLYFNIAYNDYFLKLGIMGKYMNENGTGAFDMNQNEIVSKINALVSDNISAYPTAKFNQSNLKFTSHIEFILSYLTEFLAMLDTLMKK